MYFTIPCAKLLSALSTVKKAVPLNPTLPIVENFLFEINNEKLTIIATDLQFSIITTLTVTNAKDGKIAVPARILAATLSLLPQQENLTFDLDNETYGLVITSTHGKYKISCENASDFPEVTNIPQSQNTINLPAHILKKGFEQTIFSASQNENRPELNGVNIALTTKNTIFSAIGDNQLACYTRDDIKLPSTNTTLNQQKSLTIPTKSVQLLIQILSLPIINQKENIQITFDQAKITFSQNTYHFIARLIGEEFQPYQSAIPKLPPQGKLTIDKNNLINILKMMVVYASKSQARVKLKLDPGQDLEISALDQDFSNEAKEQHPCHYQGKKLQIGFNSKFLLSMIKQITSPKVTLHLYDPNKPAVILPSHLEPNEDLLLLLAPMLLQEPTLDT